MLNELQRLASRARVDGDQDGFTLIELLIVVVIIGILAAIAIPQFSSTKDAAYEATIESDLRNAMTTMEQEYAVRDSYPTDASLLNTSENVSSPSITKGGGGSAYCIAMTHDELGNTWGIANNSSSTIPTGETAGSYSPGTPVQSGGC